MKHIIILCTALLLLSACSNNSTTVGGMTPFPERVDLTDAKLEEAITAYIQSRAAPPNSVYDFVRTDLNGDSNREGIVLFNLPHTYWCGWDGCGMVVFKAGHDAFTPLSTISNVRGPIYVHSKTTSGWRDIIVRVSGTNLADKNVSLQFNGNTYPKNPTLAPTLHQPIVSLRTQKFFR